MAGTDLFVVGSSHRTAALADRERLSAPPERLRALEAELRSLPGWREGLLLATCNRLELYGVGGGDAELAHAAANRLRAFHGLGEAEFAALTFRHEGPAALAHLFEVAAGLDSQMVGEAEILGQVKEAYADAAARGLVGPALHRVLQKCFQAAKLVRTETAIARGQVSIGNVAADLAERVLGDLRRASALVLGAGEAGEKTVEALRGRGTARLAVSGRTESRAAGVAARAAAEVLAWDAWPARLAEFDILLGSTSAPGAVVSAELVQRAAKARRGRPLFLVDLAVPRDIEPAAGALENVFLYNLDDLAAIANENLRARLAEVDRCREILHRRAGQLWEDLRRRAGA